MKVRIFNGNGTIQVIDIGNFDHLTYDVFRVMKEIIFSDTGTADKLILGTTYLYTFNIGCNYKAIVQHFNTNNYASAIVFGYALQWPLYFRKTNGELYYVAMTGTETKLN